MTLPYEVEEKVKAVVDMDRRESEFSFCHESKEGKVYISITDGTSLVNLEDLNKSLQYTVKPIDPYKSLWVGLMDCDLFMMYAEELIQSKEVLVATTLAQGLFKIKELLVQLLTSQLITYDQITIGGNLQLEKVEKHLNKDFERICRAVDREANRSVSTLRGIQSMIELLRAIPRARAVVNCCKQLSLKGCLKDQSFIDLSKIQEELASEDKVNLSSVTAKLATEQMEIIRRTLHFDQMDTLDLFPLFQRVIDARTFYNFVQEQFFSGSHSLSSAVDSFRTWHQIISTQLQNEPFEEQVLHEMSHAFTCIVPFMDKRQSFQELLAKVLQVDPSNRFLELQTVTDNMHLIKRWSVQAEVRY